MPVGQETEEGCKKPTSPSSKSACSMISVPVNYAAGKEANAKVRLECLGTRTHDW